MGINRLVLGWLKLVYSLLHLLLVTDGFKALAMTGLLGLGVVVAELRGDRPMRLGRLAVSAGLAGVFVSSLAWFLLSWQQEESYDCQADYLLDNIQLNAEQVMVSRLSLMRRMADRLDAGGGEIDPALLRWNPPVRGYVSPEVFIPLAESTGQIISLSRWVLERACADMVALGQQGVGSVKVAVNLSPLQFHRPSFLATLDQVLQQSGLPAEQLELELTEGILMDNTESAIEILHALRAMHIGVSIDDFGTGYSSLSYLRHLPISKVKIDRSFINEVTTDPHDAAIVQGMISMAGHLGLKVVAEGVETEEQRRQLEAWGCDIFQGFLMARPMPLEALSHFIVARQLA